MASSAGRPPERVLIVSASVGAGHDGAARELEDRLAGQGVVVRTHDFLDALPAWLRVTVREGYTRTVTHTPWFYDWLYAAMERPGLVQRLGLLVSSLGRRQVQRWVEELGADAVVSTYPLASQALGQLVRRGRLRVPTATFLTDPSVHALWVHRHVHRHLTVLPVTAALGETGYGVPMTVAGPLVPARFATAVSEERRAEVRAGLGASPDRPLALVVTGSLGLGDVVSTVRAIEATGVATPVVLCGRNTALLHALGERPGVLAFGWRDDVHELMQVCDVLVHNAGGLSFSESLVAGLPAVTYACIPGHGRANGEALAHGSVAPLADDVTALGSALRRQLRPDARSDVRSSLAPTGHDATGFVLDDLRTRGASVGRQADVTRGRRRTTLRRQLSGLAAAALVAGSTLAATAGVSAATQQGYGVSRMPTGTVALVLAPRRLSGARAEVARLRSLHASVEVPARPTTGDVAAARSLAAAGVQVLVPGCAGSTLLRHPERPQRCGAARTLAAAGVPAGRAVVRGPELEALDLLVSRRDGSHLVTGRSVLLHRVGPSSHGQVWLVDQDSPGATHDVRAALHRAERRARQAGLRPAGIGDARAHR